jgi:hypothetical protein
VVVEVEDGVELVQPLLEASEGAARALLVEQLHQELLTQAAAVVVVVIQGLLAQQAARVLL